MIDHRGFSLIELLVAALLTTMVAVGLFSAYLATARSLRDAGMQTALQRQGTLALEDIGRQVQSAGDSKDLTTEAFTPGATCNGHANSVQVNTPSGTVCYYATSDGALCEFRGVSCRNLLAGGLGTIALLKQSEPPDARCPIRHRDRCAVLFHHAEPVVPETGRRVVRDPGQGRRTRSTAPMPCRSGPR